MTFSDIFKSSFLENVTAVSPLDMVLTIVLAFGIGLSFSSCIRKPIRESCIRLPSA